MESDPLKLARDIRKRLHLIADPSVRLDMEACCDAIERLAAVLCEEIHRCNNTHLGSTCTSCERMSAALR